MFKVDTQQTNDDKYKKITAKAKHNKPLSVIQLTIR